MKTKKTTFIFFLCFFISSSILAQVAIVHAGGIGSFYKNAGTALGGQMNIAFESKMHAFIGAGAGFLKFKNDNTAYVPIYGTLGRSFYTRSSVIGLHFNVGYGLYHPQTTYYIPNSSTTSKGGIYFNPGIEVHGKGKLSPYLDLGYSLYQFTSRYNGQTTQNNLNAATISFGICILNKKR